MSIDDIVIFIAVEIVVSVSSPDLISAYVTEDAVIVVPTLEEVVPLLTAGYSHLIVAFIAKDLIPARVADHQVPGVPTVDIVGSEVASDIVRPSIRLNPV